MKKIYSIMKHGPLALLFVVTLLACSTSHTNKQHLQHNGKAVDPKCVYAANKRGVDLDNCPDFSGDGFSPDSETRTSNTEYEFIFDGRQQGWFKYDFIGPTDEGLAISYNYSTGGTGIFSYLGIYKIENNRLYKSRRLAGGDRCAKGILAAKIDKGGLVYSYNITPLDLYRLYIPGANYRPDFGSGFVNCGAVIHTRNEKVEKIELLPDALIPTCARDLYEQQIATSVLISEDQA